jgi:intein/homing endonuclease
MIGTYQSLVKMEPEFYEDVEAVFVDECIHPESLITMSDGSLKKIKEVNIGESVLTINNITGGIEENEVEFVYHNLSKENQMYEIETESGEKLKVTGNHKLRLKNGEWKRVDELSENDELWDI